MKMSEAKKNVIANIRKAVKDNLVPVRVRSQFICGVECIQVYKTQELRNTEFLPEMIAVIIDAAIENGLTGARGTPIDPEIELQLSGKNVWNFEFHE